MKYLSTFNLFESTKLAAMAYMGSKSDMNFYSPNERWYIKRAFLRTPFGSFRVNVSNEDVNSETCNFKFSGPTNQQDPSDRGFIDLFLEVVGRNFQFDDPGHYKFVRYYLTKSDLLDEEFFGYIYPDQQGFTEISIKVLDEDDRYWSSDIKKPPATIISAIVNFKEKLKRFKRWDNTIMNNKIKIAQWMEELMEKSDNSVTSLTNIFWESITLDAEEGELNLNLPELLFICYYRFDCKIKALDKRQELWTSDDFQELSTYFINL